MHTRDFEYYLPPALIAQRPLPERAGSRLLVLAAGGLEDRYMRDFCQVLQPNDLLVFNNTRVVKARLRGRKQASGGQVEIMVERVLDRHTALVMLRASKTPPIGTRILVGPYSLEVLGREGEFFRVLCPAPGWPLLMACLGAVPLPPYIARTADSSDSERYQSLLAARDGAVAAPTASLHFDESLLSEIQNRGIQTAQVTLHVGAGTFQPVRAERVADHRMHAERFEVDAGLVRAVAETKARGGRVVAIGTTVVRALESAACNGELHASEGDTEIFIYPGYRFQVVDALLTNFHLPRSSLLMLVGALAGVGAIREAYAHAVAARYRFFSYGDAMFIPSALRG